MSWLLLLLQTQCPFFALSVNKFIPTAIGFSVTIMTFTIMGYEKFLVFLCPQFSNNKVINVTELLLLYYLFWLPK